MTLPQRWKRKCRTGQWGPNYQQLRREANLLGFRYQTPLTSLILKKRPWRKQTRATDWRLGCLLTAGKCVDDEKWMKERIHIVFPMLSSIVSRPHWATPQNTKAKEVRKISPMGENLIFQTPSKTKKELPNLADRRLQNGSLEETKVLIDQNQRRSSPSCSLRRLAIMSIVCGISCVGIKALLLALRAEREVGVKNYEVLARRSRRFAVLSIVLFVGGLLLLPVLVVLISYIMTLIE